MRDSMKKLLSITPRTIAIIVLLLVYATRFCLMSLHRVSLLEAVTFTGGLITVYILVVDGMADRRRKD